MYLKQFILSNSYAFIIMTRYKLFIFLIFFSPFSLLAQNIHKADTVYFLIDTLNTPLKERLWTIGIENPIYYYNLHCNCYTENSNPTFGYNVKLSQNERIITKEELLNIKTIDTKQLIDIITQYGLNKQRNHVFYFIEPRTGKYVLNEVVLPEYRKRVPIN